MFDRCITCKDDHLISVHHFGKQPLANAYTNTAQESVDSPRYDLHLLYCIPCSHMMLSSAIDPTVLFNEYAYVSGTTKTLRTYFEQFANFVESEFVPGQHSILDIGCNDGTQLEVFKNRGWDVFGVDPAQNLERFTAEKHIPTMRKFWNLDVASELRLIKTFDAIIAQNVFAHTANIDEFLEACALVLNSNGKLFIQTSQANMVQNKEFDTVYHEHISFFSIKSMITLASRMKWSVTNVFKVPVHGTSYIFTLEKTDEPHLPENVWEEYKAEAKTGRYMQSVIKDYGESIKHTLKWLDDTLEDLVGRGYCIYGFGVTAKSMTVLNSMSHPHYIVAIIDENPLKIGKFCSSYGIPIYGPEAELKLEGFPNTAILMTAWNFSDEIIAKLKTRTDLNENTLLIYYAPEQKVVKLYE